MGSRCSSRTKCRARLFHYQRHWNFLQLSIYSALQLVSISLLARLTRCSSLGPPQQLGASLSHAVRTTVAFSDCKLYAYYVSVFSWIGPSQNICKQQLLLFIWNQEFMACICWCTQRSIQDTCVQATTLSELAPYLNCSDPLLRCFFLLIFACSTRCP